MAVSFNQLYQCDHSRVKQVLLYCQAEDRPVSRDELVKGYEYEKDRYVVIEERELAEIAPRSSRVMEVLEFVPEAEVDPVYLDASYYVAPERAGERRAARLLHCGWRERPDDARRPQWAATRQPPCPPGRFADPEVERTEHSGGGPGGGVSL